MSCDGVCRPALAGLAYFALVFAAGFVLGTIRVLVLVPWIGEIAAILVELPILLTLAWVVAGWVVRRFTVPAATSSRLIMGGVAFCALMLAEAGLSVLLFGSSLAAHLARYRETATLLGLSGQIAFALFPLLRAGFERGSRR